MHLPLFIAKRYLFAKKSHNVINIISAISVAGMAIGTAALVIILSVYNGFDDLVSQSLDDVAPDIRISPATGKTFVPDRDTFDSLRSREDVADVCEVLEDQVFLSYEGNQGIATAKGVDSSFVLTSPLVEHVMSGAFTLRKGDLYQCAVGSTLAYKLEMNPAFVEQVEIWYPDRDKRISMSNPTASINSIRAGVSSTFSVNSDTDAELMVLPIEAMRELLGCDEDEVSAIEIRMKPGGGTKATEHLIKELKERLGDGFSVKDRIAQNDALYKMMKYEKTAIYLILIFVVIIIAFNIFGSLTMLIIEKKDDISTFYAMGATETTVKHIFVLEGWLISMMGMVIGLVSGVCLALLQQHFGIIKMPGNFVVSSYPVILKAGDLLITAVSVAVIGYIIALIPATKYNLEQ